MLSTSFSNNFHSMKKKTLGFFIQMPIWNLCRNQSMLNIWKKMSISCFVVISTELNGSFQLFVWFIEHTKYFGIFDCLWSGTFQVIFLCIALWIVAIFLQISYEQHNQYTLNGSAAPLTWLIYISYSRGKYQVEKKWKNKITHKTYSI